MPAYESLILRFGVSGVEEVQKGTKQLASEITQLKRHLNVASGEMRTTGVSMEGLTHKQEILKEMIRKTSIILDRAEDDLRSYITAQQATGNQVDETSRDFQRLSGVINKYTANLKEQEYQLKATENRMDTFNDEQRNATGISQNLGNVVRFNAMMGLRELGQELMQVSAAFVNYTKEAFALSKSSDASVETVRRNFGELADEQIAWAKETSANLGLFEGDVLQTTAQIYGLSESYGMMSQMFVGETAAMTLSGEDLATISQELTVLAYDLAATYDKPVDQALNAVLSGYRGNIAAIEDYGISLQATMLQEQANKLGMDKSVETMTQAEKNYLAYRVMMESTTKAQGRWKEELDAGLIPQLELQNSLKTLQKAFGDALSPAISKSLGIVNDFVKSMSEMDGSVASLVGGIGVAIAAFAGLSTIAGFFLMIAMTFGTTVGTVFLPMVGVIGAVGIAVYGLIESMRTGKTWIESIGTAFEDLRKKLNEFAPHLGDISVLLVKFIGIFLAYKTAIASVGGILKAVGAIKGLVVALKAGGTALGVMKVAFGLFAGTASTAAAATGAAATATTAVAGGAVAATAALAPFAVAIGVAAAAVGGIVLAYQTWQAYQNELSADAELDYSEGVSEATQSAVDSYLELESAAIGSLNDMYSHQQVVTEDMATNFDNQTQKMADSITTALQGKFTVGIDGMTEFYKYSDGIVDAGEQAQLDTITKAQEEKVATVQGYQDEIASITKTAQDENRSFTESEQARIKELTKKMQDEAIIALSTTEQEKLLIQNDFAQQGDDLSLKYMSDQLTRSAEARDKQIEDAGTLRDGVLLSLSTLKGQIPDVEYDNLVTSANETYDQMVLDAETTHGEVVDWMGKLDSEFAKYVNPETGKIMTNGEMKTYYSDLGKEILRVNGAFSENGAEALKAQHAVSAVSGAVADTKKTTEELTAAQNENAAANKAADDASRANAATVIKSAGMLSHLKHVDLVNQKRLSKSVLENSNKEMATIEGNDYQDKSARLQKHYDDEFGIRSSAKTKAEELAKVRGDNLTGIELATFQAQSSLARMHKANEENRKAQDDAKWLADRRAFGKQATTEEESQTRRIANLHKNHRNAQSKANETYLQYIDRDARKYGAEGLRKEQIEWEKRRLGMKMSEEARLTIAKTSNGQLLSEEEAKQALMKGKTDAGLSARERSEGGFLSNILGLVTGQKEPYSIAYKDNIEEAESKSESPLGALKGLFKFDLAITAGQNVNSFATGLRNSLWANWDGLKTAVSNWWQSLFGDLELPDVPQPITTRHSGNQEQYSLEPAAYGMSRLAYNVPDVSQYATGRVVPAKNKSSKPQNEKPTQNVNINVTVSDANIYDTRDIRSIADDLASEMKRQMFNKGVLQY